MSFVAGVNSDAVQGQEPTALQVAEAALQQLGIPKDKAKLYLGAGPTEDEFGKTSTRARQGNYFAVVKLPDNRPLDHYGQFQFRIFVQEGFQVNRSFLRALTQSGLVPTT